MDRPATPEASGPPTAFGSARLTGCHSSATHPADLLLSWSKAWNRPVDIRRPVRTHVWRETGRGRRCSFGSKRLGYRNHKCLTQLKKQLDSETVHGSGMGWHTP